MALYLLHGRLDLGVRQQVLRLLHAAHRCTHMSPALLGGYSKQDCKHSCHLKLLMPMALALPALCSFSISAHVSAGISFVSYSQLPQGPAALGSKHLSLEAPAWAPRTCQKPALHSM